MKGHGSDDDMPDGNERCRECHEQYCDGYDSGDPVHKKCVGDPGAGSAIDLEGAVPVKTPKVERWGLKVPRGWLVEGARGLFTHTDDARLATTYSTRTAAQEAVLRAGRSVEVGAVTYERVRVSGHRSFVLLENLKTGDEYLVEFENGFTSADSKETATRYSSYEGAEAARKRAEKSCSGPIKIDEFREPLKGPIDAAPRRWALKFSSGWAILGGLGVSTQVTSDVRKATLFSGPHAARDWAEREGAKAVDVTRELHTPEIGKGSEEGHPPPRATDASHGPAVPLHWVVEKLFRGKAHFLKENRKGKKPIFAKNVEDATKYCSEPHAIKAARTVKGGKPRAIYIRVDVMTKKNMKWLTPEKKLEIAYPGVSSCPSIYKGHACLMGFGGKHDDFHAWWDEEGPVDPDTLENATRIEWDAKGRRIVECLKCRAKVPHGSLAKNLCRACYAGMRLSFGDVQITNGDLVRHAHDEEFSRRMGTGVVQATDVARSDGPQVKVRWSKSDKPGEPSTEDVIGFHTADELRHLTEAEEQMLAQPRLEMTLHELTEDPQVRLPLTVLKGLKLMRRTIRKLRELDDESEEPRRLKWDSNEDRRAVLQASLWIRSISKAIVKPKKRKKEKRRDRDRVAYHEMLDRAMDDTRQGSSFLPEFTKLVLEDVIDLGPTERRT